MNCQECIQECKEGGGLCAPPSEIDRENARDMGFDADEAYKLHQQIGHAMPLIGGFYRCDQGHEPVEAHPADAMREAGMERLI